MSDTHSIGGEQIVAACFLLRFFKQRVFWKVGQCRRLVAALADKGNSLRLITIN